MKFKQFPFSQLSRVFILAPILFSTAVLAMDSTDVLPANVNSPALRMGSVQNVNQRYNSSGDLVSLNDLHSIEFNVKTLSTIEPQVNQLVAALNSFGSSTEKYGDSLSLGVLKVNVKPQVDYVAPVHAWGINERWTMGFGVPVVHYRAQFSFTQEGSNLDQYRQQFEGRVSPELDSAFQKLSVSLPQAAASELDRKGYQAMGERDKKFIGDIPIVSVYKFYDDGRVATVHKGTLSLPTGPKDNPDDLEDMGGFGLLSMTNEVVSTYRYRKSWNFNARGGLKYVFPDQVDKRVPSNNADTLPDQSQKERVTRETSPTTILGTSAAYKISREWASAVGYEYNNKSRDRIRGNKGGSYAVLEDYTDSTLHRSRLELSYSTVQAYLDKTAMVPTTFSLEVSDVFAGKNIPRQTLTELTWMLFY